MILKRARLAPLTHIRPWSPLENMFEVQTKPTVFFPALLTFPSL